MKNARIMRKVVFQKYGDSNVLKVCNVEKPKLIKNNSLLIEVKYSSLNAIDWKNRKGVFRIVSGICSPRTEQGFDIAGIIKDKSRDVHDFEINDQIVCQLCNFKGGALSKYVVVNVKNVVKLKHKIPLKHAAGLPMAGTTAWHALLKEGKLKKGDKVLINGGSSGVGHLAIQIAKAFGAEVTSVSSSKNLKFCKILGADNVISYQNENFLNLTCKFDIIFDVIFNSSFKETRHLLMPNGYYIGTTPSVKMLKESLLYKQAKFVSVFPDKDVLNDLIRIMNEGKLNVIIDKIFNMNNIIEAHNYLEKSRTVGKLIIKI